VDSTNNNNSDDGMSSIKWYNMKNIDKKVGYIIVIIFWLVIISVLSSCGIKFGDYDAWQEDYGERKQNTNQIR